MVNKELRFEDALKKLEEIVERLEAGNVSLDESLAAYEEGMRMVRFCSGKLDEAEQRILAVHKTDDGSDLVPFGEVDA